MATISLLRPISLRNDWEKREVDVSYRMHLLLEATIFDWWEGGIMCRLPRGDVIQVGHDNIAGIHYNKGDKVPGVDPKP